MSSRPLSGILGLLSVALAASQAWAGKPFDAYPPAVSKYFTQAEKLQEQGRYREAIAAYNEAIRLGMGDYAEIYRPLAECYRKLGEYNQVVSTLTRVIEEFDLNSACRH